MANKALLDAVPDARRKTIYSVEDGVTRIESVQDCEHIVRAASILADEPPGKDFRLIGFIPEAALNQMFLDGSFHDRKALRRWLDENPHCKVHKG